MSSAHRPPVTVIGLGPMGQAMVRAFMSAGHPITVWNRTASRADAVVSDGAVRSASAAESVAASGLVILSLTDYRAMYDILETAVDTLAGKTIVNLSSDTPDTTREASAWASEHGAQFIAGGVMVPAPMIGTEAAYVYYSGPKDAFDEHADTLGVIGRSEYVGDDPGLAPLFYQAQLTVFLTALSGLLQGTALVSAAGVSPRTFVPQALGTIAGIPAMVGDGAELARSLESAAHPGDLATVVMMGATADHIVGTSTAAGVDLELPLAIKSHYDRAINAGHGTDSWSSLFEIIKHQS